MYCTPCARLIKSMTPKTRVRPEAIRNRRTPSCNPLSTCTMKRVVFIEVRCGAPLRRSFRPHPSRRALKGAPQDEAVSCDPHGEERREATRLEPWDRRPPYLGA